MKRASFIKFIKPILCTELLQNPVSGSFLFSLNPNYYPINQFPALNDLFGGAAGSLMVPGS